MQFFANGTNETQFVLSQIQIPITRNTKRTNIKYFSQPLTIPPIPQFLNKRFAKYKTISQITINFNDENLLRYK